MTESLFIQPLEFPAPAQFSSEQFLHTEYMITLIMLSVQGKPGPAGLPGKPVSIWMCLKHYFAFAFNNAKDD